MSNNEPAFMGTIRLGTRSCTEYDKDGNPIYYVESETLNNILELLKLDKDRLDTLAKGIEEIKE